MADGEDNRESDRGEVRSNAEKDPEDWVTGDEPMTGAQRSYLQTLSHRAGVDFDENLTKAQASERIEELQGQTRGGGGGDGDGAPADGDDASSAEKDPADWVTGDEPMTGAQRSYLQTLSQEAGEPFDDSLNKADASKRIDELRQRTGRGGS